MDVATLEFNAAGGIDEHPFLAQLGVRLGVPTRMETVQSGLYGGGMVVDVRVDEAALERLGRALADDSRRRILMMLLDGPAYPAELAEALGLGRANTSNHLSCLRGCGLVVAEPEGRRVRYELADERLAVALRTLADVVLSTDPDCSHGR